MASSGWARAARPQRARGGYAELSEHRHTRGGAARSGDGVERDRLGRDRAAAGGGAVLGQVVERVLALRAAREGVEWVPCPHYGGAMRRVDLARGRHIQGVVDDYIIQWVHDLCNECRRGQAPLDAWIGLGPGRSRHRSSGRCAAWASKRPSRRPWTRRGGAGDDGRRRDGAARHRRPLLGGGRGRLAGRRRRHAAGTADRGDSAVDTGVLAIQRRQNASRDRPAGAVRCRPWGLLG